MNTLRTARERARATVVADIKATAQRHVASEGAPALSLRAVARELGMVSSAIYRYFPSRDDLLTALIVDAYDDLGAQAEQAAAASARAPAGRRWLAVARAVREWAEAHPHEYALLYGSPIPGYRAPQTTVAPAARVAFALAGVVRDAWERGEITIPLDNDVVPDDARVAESVAADARRVAEALELRAPIGVVARMLIAWTQLFGMLSFSLFGHLVGSVD
ncbi:MAG TPA: TetR/AcrR family transcriptional regulator, partial [Acidimicrobiia bacterium]